MKYTWIRSLVFFILTVISTLAAICLGRALIHKEVRAEQHRLVFIGYEYVTASTELATIHFYADSEFAIECDGTIVRSEASDLPPDAVYNFKRVVECKRVVILQGTPVMRSETILTGVDMQPADKVFLMALLGLVAVFFWAFVCFFLIE